MTSYDDEKEENFFPLLYKYILGIATLFISIFAIAFVSKIGWIIVQFVWTHDALRL